MIPLSRQIVAGLSRFRIRSAADSVDRPGARVIEHDAYRPARPLDVPVHQDDLQRNLFGYRSTEWSI